MEIDLETRERTLVAYDNCCIEMEAIARKVENPDVPEGKKEKLIRRYCLLADKVRPELLKRMEI